MAIYFFNSWLPTLLSGRSLSGTEVVVISTSLQFGGIIGTLLAAPIVVRLPPFLTTSLRYLWPRRRWWCWAAAAAALAS